MRYVNPMTAEKRFYQLFLMMTDNSMSAVAPGIPFLWGDRNH